MSSVNSIFITKRRATRGALLLAGVLAAGLALSACGDGGGGTQGPVDPCVENAINCTPLATLLDTGLVVYTNNCTGCHGSEGNGSAGGVPPLANSDFFMANKLKTIQILLTGYSEPIVVNGLQYQSTMPEWPNLSSLQIASVLTYLRVSKNDSNIVSCDTANIDPEGFAVCQKTPRTLTERNSDTVAVWQVKHIRDSLNIPEP